MEWINPAWLTRLPTPPPAFSMGAALAPEPCPICYEEEGELKEFACTHKLCHECCGSLRSLECPFCRADLSGQGLCDKQIAGRAESDRREREEEFAWEDWLDAPLAGIVIEPRVIRLLVDDAGHVIALNALWLGFE